MDLGVLKRWLSHHSFTVMTTTAGACSACSPTHKSTSKGNDAATELSNPREGNTCANTLLVGSPGFFHKKMEI